MSNNAPSTTFSVRRDVTLSGHLMDSLTLCKVLECIESHGGDYALNTLTIGRTRKEFSFAAITVMAPDNATLEAIIAALQPHIDTTPPAHALSPTSGCRTHGPSPLAQAQRPQILVCAPDYFTIDYAINPWMTAHGPCDTARAHAQWDALVQAIASAGADCHRLPPQAGWPDLVFTANAAFVYGDLALLAHYKFAERQGEEPHVQRWFNDQGFRTIPMPPGIHFEGAGDALVWRDRVFAGYKTRTDLASHALITEHTGLPVLSLELIDPRFYHIDVCLCPLADDYLLFFPGAFDDWGQRVVRANVPPDRLIEVSPQEAAAFACNAVNIHRTVILNTPSPRLQGELEARGFTVVGLAMDEFLKSGGSCKCLTLRVG